MLEELLSNPSMLLGLTYASIFWEACWKLWALWIAGNKKDKFWFVVLFLLSTVGILPIIYIFIISKQKKRKK
ncbi:MAG: DUF5652 family protein [Candidatus Aenigmarchaeota archaeon]|nr:DUF5652 family protein [Candidatus Aenigmarchaeota archaeon]